MKSFYRSEQKESKETRSSEVRRVYRHWTRASFSPGSVHTSLQDAASEQTQRRGLNHQHKGFSGEGWATERCYDMVSNSFPESGIERGLEEEVESWTESSSSAWSLRLPFSPSPPHLNFSTVTVCSFSSFWKTLNSIFAQDLRTTFWS